MSKEDKPPPSPNHGLFDPAHLFGAPSLGLAAGLHFPHLSHLPAYPWLGRPAFPHAALFGGLGGIPSPLLTHPLPPSPDFGGVDWWRAASEHAHRGGELLMSSLGHPLLPSLGTLGLDSSTPGFEFLLTTSTAAAAAAPSEGDRSALFNISKHLSELPSTTTSSPSSSKRSRTPAPAHQKASAKTSTTTSASSSSAASKDLSLAHYPLFALEAKDAWQLNGSAFSLGSLTARQGGAGSSRKRRHKADGASSSSRETKVAKTALPAHSGGVALAHAAAHKERRGGTVGALTQSGARKERRGGVNEVEENGVLNLSKSAPSATVTSPLLPPPVTPGVEDLSMKKGDKEGRTATNGTAVSDSISDLDPSAAGSDSDSSDDANKSDSEKGMDRLLAHHIDGSRKQLLADQIRQHMLSEGHPPTSTHQSTPLVIPSLRGRQEKEDSNSKKAAHAPSLSLINFVHDYGRPDMLDRDVLGLPSTSAALHSASPHLAAAFSFLPAELRPSHLSKEESQDSLSLHTSEADDKPTSGSERLMDSESPSGWGSDDDNSPHTASLSASPGPSYCEDPSKRRNIVLNEKELLIPLEHGWRRQTTIHGMGRRGIVGEVLYFAPCNKKMKTIPDVMRYLDRHAITDLSRENFTFNTKVNVGQFYEIRDKQVVRLTEVEIMERIAMSKGKRARMQMLAKKKCEKQLRQQALAKQLMEAKFKKRQEQQDMARKAAEMRYQMRLEKEQQKEMAKKAKQVRLLERQREKERSRIMKQQEKVRLQEQLRIEREMKAQQILEARRRRQTELEEMRLKEIARKNQSNLLWQQMEREREMKKQQQIMEKEQEKERRRQHFLLLKALEQRKKEEERVERERQRDERIRKQNIERERKLAQRQIEMLIAREMKKPMDDMELRNGKSLPKFCRCVEAKLPGPAFSDALMAVEFVHNFADALGLDSESLPSLEVFQNGLLNTNEEDVEEVVTLYLHLLRFALDDLGVPNPKSAMTALNQKITDLEITDATMSEVTRLFLFAHGEKEMSQWLQDIPLEALNATKKAAIIAFLCNELLSSKRLSGEIERTLEAINTLRRDKWIVEGQLRKLRTVRARKFLKLEVMGPTPPQPPTDDDSMTNTTIASSKAVSDEEEEKEEEDEEKEEEEEGMESFDDNSTTGNRSEDEDEGLTKEEMDKKIDKLAKQHNSFDSKVADVSKQLRGTCLGQDRFKRFYWILPYTGGVFVEGMESGEREGLPYEAQLLVQLEARKEEEGRRAEEEGHRAEVKTEKGEELQAATAAQESALKKESGKEEEEDWAKCVSEQSVSVKEEACEEKPQSDQSDSIPKEDVGQGELGMKGDGVLSLSVSGEGLALQSKTADVSTQGDSLAVTLPHTAVTANSTSPLMVQDRGTATIGTAALMVPLQPDRGTTTTSTAALPLQDRGTTTTSTAALTLQDRGNTTTSAAALTVPLQDRGTTTTSTAALPLQDRGTTTTSTAALPLQNRGTTTTSTAALPLQDRGTTASTAALTVPLQDRGTTTTSTSALPLQDRGTTTTSTAALPLPVRGTTTEKAVLTLPSGLKKAGQRACVQDSLLCKLNDLLLLPGLADIQPKADHSSCLPRVTSASQVTDTGKASVAGVIPAGVSSTSSSSVPSSSPLLYPPSAMSTPSAVTLTMSSLSSMLTVTTATTVTSTPSYPSPLLTLSSSSASSTLSSLAAAAATGSCEVNPNPLGSMMAPPSVTHSVAPTSTPTLASSPLSSPLSVSVADGLPRVTPLSVSVADGLPRVTSLSVSVADGLPRVTPLSSVLSPLKDRAKSLLSMSLLSPEFSTATLATTATSKPGGEHSPSVSAAVSSPKPCVLSPTLRKSMSSTAATILSSTPLSMLAAMSKASALSPLSSSTVASVSANNGPLLQLSSMPLSAESPSSHVPSVLSSSCAVSVLTSAPPPSPIASVSPSPVKDRKSNFVSIDALLKKDSEGQSCLASPPPPSSSSTTHTAAMSTSTPVSGGNNNKHFLNPSLFPPSPLVSDHHLKSYVDILDQKPWFSILPRIPCDEVSLTLPKVVATSASSSVVPGLGVVSSDNIASASLSLLSLLPMQHQARQEQKASTSSSTSHTSHTPTQTGETQTKSVLDFTSAFHAHLSQSGLEDISMTVSTATNTPDLSLCSDSFKVPAPPSDTSSMFLSTEVMIDFDPTAQLMKIQGERLPIPLSKQRGWWKIEDAQQVRELFTCLLPRGIREKNLSHMLRKHMEFICNHLCKVDTGKIIKQEMEDKPPAQSPAEESPQSSVQAADSKMVTKTTETDDPGFLIKQEIKTESSEASETKGTGDPAVVKMEETEEEEIEEKKEEEEEKDDAVPKEDEDSWSLRVRFEVEMACLEDVEALEDRIFNASLQTKVWKLPQRASEDPEIRMVDRSVVDPQPPSFFPMDVARHRLLLLESNVERRYLKPPLIRNVQLNLATLGTERSSEPRWAADRSSSEGKCADEEEEGGGASEAPSVDYNEDVPPGLNLWRRAVRTACTPAQLNLCTQLLGNSIAWEKSIMKVTCQICMKDDNEAELLLCDGCDKGYHTYCFKPKMDNIPDGDWYCYECVSKVSGKSHCIVCGGQGGKMVECERCPRAIHTDCLDPPLPRMPKKWQCAICIQTKSKKSCKRKKKEAPSEQATVAPSGGRERKDSAASTPRDRRGSEVNVDPPTPSPEKKKKEATKEKKGEKPVKEADKKKEEKVKEEKKKVEKPKKKVEEKSEPKKKKSKKKKEEEAALLDPTGKDPDMVLCTKLLLDLQNSDDGWPFMRPVSTKQFPSYRRYIKQPMDFTTMKNKLRDNLYKERGEVAADLKLIWTNCETFNEDDSEVGQAGHSLHRMFLHKWKELFSNDVL